LFAQAAPELANPFWFTTGFSTADSDGEFLFLDAGAKDLSALYYRAFDAVPSPTTQLVSVPGTDSPAQVMFTIRLIGKDKQSVELEIALTPASAACYEIKGGPLHLTKPSSTQSDKIFWAAVQATGPQQIQATGNRRELSPALVFQARV